MDIQREFYFPTYKHALQVDFDENNPSSLREAQAGAYWAVRSHFTESSDKCVVIMPTGSGKTALMTLISFSVVATRLLIVVPSRVIREQIAKEFRSLQVAKDSGSIPPDLPTPNILVVEHQLVSKEAWNDLYAYDVVIATPNCVSPKHKSVFSDPPKDIFDTIFFDEAHHLPATTWAELVNYFEQAKIVSFTATPFRNDKLLIPGEFIYNYPLKRAIEKRIYRPIEYIPVDGLGTRSDCDRRLAEKAKEIWENEVGETVAKILVRVERKIDTVKIQNLYRVLGMNLEIVDSDYSLDDNEAALLRVMQNEDTHGIIAVGMLGEGLDLPVLKIAVMHAPHQSFPITLQFIGRICRTAQGVDGTSKLIAIPSEVQEHTKGLYDLDANWIDLIPQLADASVDLERERRRFSRDHWDTAYGDNQISIHSIRPAFAVCVYEVAAGNNIFANLELKKDINLFQTFASTDNNWRIIVTRSHTKPLWLTSPSLQDTIYDLHIYYQTQDLLFECSTSPTIAQSIRNNFGGGVIRLVNEERIQQIISQSPLVAYYNVGLRRAAYSSTTIPTYKVMAGSRAEDTIREADGNFFSVGHLFGKVNWQDRELVLGFSSQKAKIWSSTRDHMQEFTKWCDDIANIIKNAEITPLRFVDHLKKAIQISRFPEKPYCGVFHKNSLDHLVRGAIIEIIKVGGSVEPFLMQGLPEIIVNTDGWDPAASEKCFFAILIGDYEVPIQCDLTMDKIFMFQPGPTIENCLFKISENGRTQEYSISDYLSEFPPTIYLFDGSSIVGNYHYPYRSRLNQVPNEIFKVLDWDSVNCEIKVEDFFMMRDPQRRQRLISAGRRSVIDSASILLPRILENLKLFFTDHRTGEIADFIGVTDSNEGPTIHLFHCKASKTNQPGMDQRNAFDVLGQARTCLRWLFRNDLFDLIRERANHQNIFSGSLDEFNLVVNGITPQRAKYAVYVVQPGFSIQAIQAWRDEAMRLMFVSLYDELKNQDVDFFVIGSQ